MIKKLIPIFVFIFSIFLIGNNKVNAYYSNNENGIINYHLGIYESDSENYRKKFTKENYNLFLKKITGLDYMYDYINNVKKEDPYNFNKGYDYIKNESYKQYGKYYFAMLSASRRQYFFVTDFPEQIKITNYGYEFDNFEITALYDSNKPVYYIVTNENTGQFTSKCISSNNVMGTTGDHETNLRHFVDETNWYSSGGFYSNIPEIKISDNIKFSLYDYEIEQGTTMFYGSDSGMLSSEPNVPVIPTLKIDFLESKYNNDVFLYNKYRLSVENFNDDYVYYMGKMSEENSDMTSYNKYSEFYYENKYFRVLYGKENQMHLNNDKTYFDFILNKNDTIIVEVRDKENNYITSMTYTVTSIDETEKVLPYITTDEASTCKVTYKGNDYITCKTYTINAHFSDLTSYYLYLSTDNGETFNKVDTNYGVYTFSGKNNNENFIFKVLDKDGNYITSASYTITGISNYDDIKTFVYINVDETIGYDDELNYYYGSVYYWIYNWDSSYKLYYREDNCPKNDDKYRIYPLSHSDSLFGIGYKYTRDLYACFVVYDKDDNYLYSMTHSFYMENVYQNNNSAFYKFLDKWWTNISAPFTVFKQFVEIIKSLDYSPTSTMTPSFTVDFSYFGVEKGQSIIDFTWYLKYRDTIFNFIYLVFGFTTGVKVIHNLRHVFGGGS